MFGNAAPHVLAGMLPEDDALFLLIPLCAAAPVDLPVDGAFGLNRPAREFGIRGYSTSIIPDWMRSLSQMRDSRRHHGDAPGERMPSYGIVDFNQIDSGLNETAPYLVSLCRSTVWKLVIARRDSEEGTQGPMDRRLIADVDRQFPGFAGAVVHREMSTAETMQRYLNTPDGAVYGFAPEGTLGQAITQGPQTAIDGLWLASAYAGRAGDLPDP